MKKILMFLLIICLLPVCYATTASPTLNTIECEPSINFFIATEYEEAFPMTVLHDLFGNTIAEQFTIYEILNVDVTDNDGVVNFHFIYEFNEDNTVLAIFDAEDDDYIVIFCDILADNWISIDFTFVPTGMITMYLVSDYNE